MLELFVVGVVCLVALRVQIAVARLHSITYYSLTVNVCVAFAAAALVVVLHCRPLNFRTLPLLRPRAAHLLLVVLLVVPLALLADEVGGCVQWALGWAEVAPATVLLPARPTWIERLDRMYESQLGLPWGAALFFGCVLPAVGEELVFRGFLGRGLVARYGAFQGVLFTSVLFGLFHVDPVRIATATVFGVAVHVVYLTTRTLWAPMLLHFLNNALVDAGQRVFRAMHIDLSGRYDALHLSPVLVAASLAAVLVLLWALYRMRTRWLLTDGTPWSPGYCAAEAPPAAVEAAARTGSLGALPGLAVALVSLVLAGSLACTAGSAHERGRALDLVTRADDALNRGDLDEAIANYDRALELEPNNAALYYNRGLAHHRKNNLAQALADAEEAVRLNPDLVDVFYLRGTVHQARGDLDEAVRDYDEALRRQPDSLGARHNRAGLYLHRGDAQRAIDDYTIVLRRRPRDVESRVARGEAHELDEQYASAAMDWTEALRLQPEHREVCRRLALLRAACPDENERNPRDALALAQKAVRLGDRGCAALEALACAHAANGQFDEAVRRQQEALGLAGAAEMDGCQQRLDLYRARKPYVLPRP
jgi:tetratricopeptide (TPR) repeat protein/membrane protease YdiL (CAAX protease family)